MKITHFSYTHLGFSDLDVTNADGINQREADFHQAFADVIDAYFPRNLTISSTLAILLFSDVLRDIVFIIKK